MTDFRAIIILIFVIISASLQHIIHELSHAVVGKICGLKLIKIQWLTFHGGTKVFFENEPDFSDDTAHISKQWAYMSAAGIFATNTLAYLFAIIYFILPVGYFKLFMWVLSIMFLVTDSGYALLGSAGNFGDTYCVRRFYNLSRAKMALISLLLFIFNFLITLLVISY